MSIQPPSDEAMRYLRMISQRPESKIATIEADKTGRMHYWKKALIAAKYLEPCDYVSVAEDTILSGSYFTSYCVTPAGFDALSAEDRAAYERAEEKREYARQQHLQDIRHREDARRPWLLLVVNAIISLISVILGAYLARYTALLDWLFALTK